MGLMVVVILLSSVGMYYILYCLKLQTSNLHKHQMPHSFHFLLVLIFDCVAVEKEHAEKINKLWVQPVVHRGTLSELQIYNG